MAKRRKQGEGTLRLRKDGRWEGRIVVGYDDKGLPITKNVTAKTKTECTEKLKALKEQYGKPSEKINSEMPFGEWVDFWYQTYCKHTIRLTTQLEYESRIYKHIIPEIGAVPLNKLTQAALQQFYAKTKASGRKIKVEAYGTGLSDRVVRAIHANCRSALEKAVQEGLIRINPAIGCKLPPKKSREMKVLTQNEVIRFLNRAKEEGYYELFLLELGTGMRRGVILSISLYTFFQRNLQKYLLNLHQYPRSVAEGILVQVRRLTQPNSKSHNNVVFSPQAELPQLPSKFCDCSNNS